MGCGENAGLIMAFFLERGFINFTRFTKSSVTRKDKDNHQPFLLPHMFSLDNPTDINNQTGTPLNVPAFTADNMTLVIKENCPSSLLNSAAMGDARSMTEKRSLAGRD